MPLDECFHKYRVFNRDALRLQYVKYLDKLTVQTYRSFLTELQKPLRWRTQMPCIKTLFRATKVKEVLSYIRLEFNINFILRGMSFCMRKDTFLKCEIVTSMV